MCATLVANYKKCLTSVIANKGFSTKYQVMFCEGVKYLFDSLKCKSMYNFSEMCFSGFFLFILSLTVQINLPLNNRLIISLSVGKCTKSAGDQNINSPMYITMMDCINSAELGYLMVIWRIVKLMKNLRGSYKCDVIKCLSSRKHYAF